MEEMSQDQKPDGSQPGVSRSIKTSQKERLPGGIKKTRKCGKDGMRPSNRRRDYRATRTSQYSASISVKLPQQKVHAVLQRAPSDLRGELV